MKKYNNVDYHSVSMSEFARVLDDISDRDELYMHQFTFVHSLDTNPHFRIEFCNIEDPNFSICIYVDFPSTIPVNPYEVICKMQLLITDLQRFGFRYSYPTFSCYKCDTNDYQKSID